MIFKTKSIKNEIKGHWLIKPLVADSVIPDTFSLFYTWLLMPIELANMREDTLDELEVILQDILSEFQFKVTNGRRRFVGYIDKKEDHLIIGYQKNGVEEIDCFKICIAYKNQPETDC